MPISRETAAVAFAVAAVACLSSVFVQWSSRYPIGDADWEHPLSGNPAAANTSKAAFQEPNAAPISTTGDQLFVGSSLERPLPSEFRQIPPDPSEAVTSASFVTSVRFTEPAATQSCPSNGVVHQAPNTEAAAWLVGGIEDEADDAVESAAETSSAALRPQTPADESNRTILSKSPL